MNLNALTAQAHYSDDETTIIRHCGYDKISGIQQML